MSHSWIKRLSNEWRLVNTQWIKLKECWMLFFTKIENYVYHRSNVKLGVVQRTITTFTYNEKWSLFSFRSMTFSINFCCQ